MEPGKSELHINSTLGDLRLIEANLNTSDELMKVYAFFDEEKSIPGIILSKNGQFYGLLSRTKFFEVMSKQFMFDLFSKRKIEFFFEPGSSDQHLFLDSTVTIINAANIALNRSHMERYEPIIVRCGQNDYKLLDFYDLLHAQNAILLLMNEMLKQANEFKKEVLAIAAHDLRNPIGAILGFSGLISELPDSSDSFKPYAQIINKAAVQMEEMVNSFLVSAINDAIEFELSFTEFDIQETLTAIINNFKHSAAVKGQYLVFESEVNSLKIVSDKLKITEVIENLISNAVKYSEKGKIILVLLQQDSKNITISIKDQGPGFDETDREKMFGKFQRLSAKPTGSEPSTGIGLFTIKKIMDKIKGEISLSTEPGKGSTFFVKIPLEPGIHTK